MGLPMPPAGPTQEPGGPSKHACILNACRGFRFALLNPPDCLSHPDTGRSAYGLHRQPDARTAPAIPHPGADHRPRRHHRRRSRRHHRRHAHACPHANTHPGAHRNAGANLYALPHGHPLPHTATLANPYALPHGDGLPNGDAFANAYALPHGYPVPHGDTPPDAAAGHQNPDGC